MTRFSATWACALCLACSGGVSNGSESESESSADTEDVTETDWSGCLAAGTLVATPSGSRPIETLRVGDQVFSVDPATGERVETVVTFVRSAMRETLVFELEDVRRLQLTSDHPVYSPEHESYAHASHWRSGELQSVLVRDDEGLAVKRVVAVRPAGMAEVFDVGVAHELHNFIAGGVVVHNKEAATTHDGDGTSGEVTTSNYVPDLGPDGCGEPCDTWNPGACPEGQKCTAAACEMGGGAWDSHVCREIQGSAGLGDECAYTDGNPLSGNDDCDAGYMCWSVNPETGLGYCAPFATGSVSSPVCPDGWSINLLADLVPTWCRKSCDPLQGSCAAHEVCVLEYGATSPTCTTGAGDGAAPYATPCEFLNACDDGLVCIDPTKVPESSCDGAAGCCSPYCDLNASNTCPGAGQICEPLSVELPGYEHLGICGVPS